MADFTSENPDLMLFVFTEWVKPRADQIRLFYQSVDDYTDVELESRHGVS